MWTSIIIGIIFGAFFLAIAIASRRYEREQRKRGRWDEHGPLVESDAPPRGMRGSTMTWILEAKGLLTPRVTKRRKRGQHPRNTPYEP